MTLLINLFFISSNPIITNDAIVLGLLMGALAFVFYTSQLQSWSRFYKVVPPLLLCYFIPALFNWPLNLVSPESSGLYFVSTRYLLPATLIFLCLSIDFAGLLALGSKSIIMFLTAVFGVIIGGPIAFFLATRAFPEIIPIDPADLWKGMSTIAGSWIGGGANQTAMKEIYHVNDSLFGTMLVVDIIVANIWMGILLYGASISDKIDYKLKADNSAIKRLELTVSEFRKKVEKNPTTSELMILMAVGFVGVGISHLLADITLPIMEGHIDLLNSLNLTALNSSFFWLVFYSTTIGLLLSFTRARNLEGIGASKWGSIFIYVLVATIGMKMHLGEVFSNPGLFLIGIIWMSVHVLLLVIVAYLIKAPFFFVAVGSQASIGGAASAPIVASAFSPSLAPVGIIMAVLGYALGTYGAILCAQIMASIS